jgi:hypothetical protein
MLHIILIVALLLGAPAAHGAQDLTPTQRKILLIAVNAEGWLTEEMHREFWGEVPPDVRSDPETVEGIVAHLDRESVLGIRFQREAWTSMSHSLQQRRVVKTPNYERAKAAVVASSTLSGYSEQAEIAADNADRMIEAAASGRPFASDRGTLYLTEELVDRVLAGLEGSLYRFQRLTNPSWAIDVDEWRYPDAHARILWDGPFNKQIEEITLEGGRQGTIRILQNRLSEREFVQLGFTQFEGRWADPEAAAINVARAALAAMGVERVTPVGTYWRGRVSAEASGSATTSEGKVHAAVRVVAAPEHQGAWTFMGLTLGSTAEAVILRALLEEATQLD